MVASLAHPLSADGFYFRYDFLPSYDSVVSFQSHNQDYSKTAPGRSQGRFVDENNLQLFQLIHDSSCNI